MNLFDVLTSPVSRLSHVNRYSSMPVLRHENVAEHSFWVAFICLVLYRDIERRQNGTNVRLDTLLARALCHDLSEMTSGDIIRSYKHLNPAIKKAMDAADSEAIQRELTKMYDGSLDGMSLYMYWSLAKEPTLTGDIVRFADQVAVMIYCRGEDQAGNRNMRHVALELYTLWFKDWHQHEVLGVYADQLFPTKNWADIFADRPFDPQGELGWRAMNREGEGPVAEHEFEGEGAP